MLAIDRSASTASASGLDANGDGAVDREFCSGFRRFGTLAAMLNLCGRSPDSILDAELELAGTLLDELAPQATRIGVVTFSGDGNRRTPDAVVASPLNADPAPARAALAELDQTGPAGQTNLVEALRLATSELLAARPGPSEARSSGRVVLLSSGGPTLPARGDPRLNALLALEAAKAAARCRVSVDVYQIGNSAAEENGLLRRIAETTRGRFRLVRQLKGSEAGAVPQP